MKYLLSIYNNAVVDEAFTSDMSVEFDRAHQAIQTELEASGEFVDARQLGTPTARVVRSVDGKTLATDGPFTEGKEYVGGFYIVDCATRERAEEIAGRFFEARFSPIEVRELI
ncbi:MAG: YciI family protein [Rhodoglobus sp.]